MKKIIKSDDLIDKKHIDLYALKIVRTLQNKGFETYLVGGCVRDLLLNKKPKDFDIVTSATPIQIKRIFRNSRIIGRRFKINHIYGYQRKIYEVSTFRQAPIYNSDNDLLIKRDNLYGTVEEDAMRRDFTINSMYFDPDKNEIYDYTGAKNDINSNLLKMIGEPAIRLQEDPVRILRAIRLAAKLNLQIETKLLEALGNYAQDLNKASHRRVTDEMWKILMGENTRTSFELLVSTKVLNVVFKNYASKFEKIANKDVIYKSLEFIDFISDHPLLSKITVAPLYIQFLFWDFLYLNTDDKPLKFQNFEIFYNEKLVDILRDLDLNTKQINSVKHILYIMNLKGTAEQNIKLSKKLIARQHFHEAYFAWQVLWFVRGKHEYFDLNFLINYKQKNLRKPKHKNKYKRTFNNKEQHKKSKYKKPKYKHYKDNFSDIPE